MSSITRRSALLCGFAFFVPKLAFSGARSRSSVEEAKRDFLRRANDVWKSEHTKSVLLAKEAEKKGEFASLAPPKALVPFKDWDYYYTLGISTWAPNVGQKFAPVDVPDGFVTDLASIPKWLWSSGLRPEGPYAYAAIIHDYLYWTQERTRQESDAIFLTAMEDSKVDRKQRERIFKAVRLAGGSAWEKNKRLKAEGEKRLLRRYPPDFTVSWSEWKAQPSVFRD